MAKPLSLARLSEGRRTVPGWQGVGAAHVKRGGGVTPELGQPWVSEWPKVALQRVRSTSSQGFTKSITSTMLWREGLHRHYHLSRNHPARATDVY